MKKIIELNKNLHVYDSDNLLDECLYKIIINHDCTQYLDKCASFEFFNSENKKTNGLNINNWRILHITTENYFGRLKLNMTIIDSSKTMQTISTDGFTLAELNEEASTNQIYYATIEKLLPEFYKLTFFANFRARVDFINYIKEQNKNDEVLIRKLNNI